MHPYTLLRLCLLLCSPVASVSAATFAMNQSTGVVVPTGRGDANTTYFGWETFNEPATRNVPINDSTPDIGSASGVNFQTTNGQDHVLGSGNLYFFAGTLAEQITAVTDGVVGTGYTTLILQIASASGFGGFAGAITLSDINGVSASVVQGVDSTGTGLFWAKYELPGNQSSYTFSLAGPANQAHFSFDRVVVDTFWSNSGFQGDLFSPVPEPSRVLLLGAGLAGLACRRRRSLAVA